MLFSTSLIAVIEDAPGAHDTPDARTRLKILNMKRQATICELTFPAPVRRCQLNRRRLVAALDDALLVYDISNMRLLHTIEASSPVMALAPSSDASYLAYGGPHGSVTLCDLEALCTETVIQAHRAPIACLAINAAGTLLATASEKGTIVRVFALPDGRPVYQFRRGTYPARIHHISFNAASTLLCVTSDSDTVHIFRLNAHTPHDAAAAAEAKRATAWSAWQRRGAAVAGRVSGLLPSAWADVWEPARDFAWLKLPSRVRATAALSPTVPGVLVLTEDGQLYMYALDLERGGECRLTQRTCAAYTDYALVGTPT